MASTVWKGQLTFGLVSMPIKLIRASRPERVKLRQLYRPAANVEGPSQTAPPVFTGRGTLLPSGARIGAQESSAAKIVRLPEPAQEAALAPVRRVFQSEHEDETIAPANLIKGYEHEKGQYVVLTEQELRDIAPRTSGELQIVEFVRFGEIDALYLETSYYIVPDDDIEKPYALLFEAMRETGYAAIGQFTMHRRDHVIIVRPGKTGLIGHTMFYPDEVRSTEEFRTDTKLAGAKELDLAKSLITALAQPFDPARFKNAFRERLEQLIQSKIEGREISQVAAHAPGKIVDILDALQRSLAQAKSAAPVSDGPAILKERKPVRGEQSRRKTDVRSAKKGR